MIAEFISETMINAHYFTIYQTVIKFSDIDDGDYNNHYDHQNQDEDNH